MIRARPAAALLAASAALGAAGCEQLLGIGEPTLAVDARTDAPDAGCAEGAATITRALVMNTYRVPTSHAETAAAGFDFDGDDRADNALFRALSSFVTIVPEFDVQPTIDANLASGALLHLLEAELHDSCATTTLYEGEDYDANPADNFTGEESFRIVGTARGRMTGGRDGDAVLAGIGGAAEIRLPLFREADPIPLPLVDARIRYVVTGDGAVEGAIGGAIRRDIVDDVVIPSWATSLQGIVERECSGTAPDCCPQGTVGAAAAGLFDSDEDCVITVDEVREVELALLLFRPDLDLYDGGVLAPNVDGINDSVSLGISFTAVNGFFLDPNPP